MNQASRPRWRIAIACYPTFGGSGILATELGRALAERGHRVHVVAYDLPARFDRFTEGLTFHEVESLGYPVLPSSPYTIAMASKLVELSQRQGLDVVHVHYAVPHAVSGWLAGEVLGPARPRLLTTLHGTDSTLVGKHPAVLPIVRHAIEASDAVTVPSRYLREATYDGLGVSREVDIQVVSNFVDPLRFRPPDDPEAARLAWTRVFEDGPVRPAPASRRVLHASNFRPVKRVRDALLAFERLAPGDDAYLVLVGDGPERSSVEGEAYARGLGPRVRFVGKQSCFADLLQGADAFLTTSESESFGLAALEAMACGVPVVATSVGGVPEVVQDGVTGRLAPLGDLDALAAALRWVWAEPARTSALRVAARARAADRFSMARIVSEYETLYRAPASVVKN